MITMKLETGIGEKLYALLQHYNHARRKHPSFADRPFTFGALSDLKLNEQLLLIDRKHIEEQMVEKCLAGDVLLKCEIQEAAVEVAKKDWDCAIEELYDAAAVILRMIDMIEDIKAKEEDHG